MPNPTYNWQFSTTGYGYIYPKKVITNPDGSALTCGAFGAVTPPNASKIFGSIVTYNSAGIDAYVCKISPSGSVVWLFTIASNGDSQISDMVPDGFGGAYIIGWTSGGNANIPCTLSTTPGGSSLLVDAHPGSTPYTYNANTSLYAFSAVFVARLDSSGNRIWHRMFSNGTISSNCLGQAIKLDVAGNLLICGGAYTGVDFGGATLPLPPITFYPQFFVAKLDGATGLGLWSTGTPKGGVDPTQSYLALGPTGDVFVSGSFLTNFGDLPFDLGGGSVSRPGEGGNGAFLVKYAGADGSYLWDHTFSGSLGNGIVVDPGSGVVVSTGYAGGATGTPSIPIVFYGGGTYSSPPAGTVSWTVAYSSNGVHAWEYVLGGTNGISIFDIGLINGTLYLVGQGLGYVNFGGSVGQPLLSLNGPVFLGCVFSPTAPPVATFLSMNVPTYAALYSISAVSIDKLYVYGYDGGNQLILQQWLTASSVPTPDPANFTPVYAPSANTTFQSKFGFIWNGTLPVGATNILIKYNFPAGTITPGPGETTPFLLLNYPEPSGYFGPNAYGFVYKVTGGNGPTWGPGYTTILNWSWAAAFADASGTAIGPYTAWQNVTKSAAVNVTNNGTVASTPYANPKVTTTPTNRGNLQSISLS